MSRKFVGVQSIDTVRVGKKTFAFGVYQDTKVGRIPFAGLSEKHPNDKENADRGIAFARGRALENLGQQIQKQQWKQFSRGKTVKQAIKLSASEIKKLKSSPEAVAKRKARAAKKK
jgi:hypothetical protein